MVSHVADFEQRIRMADVGVALSKIDGSDRLLMDVRQGFISRQRFVLYFEVSMNQLVQKGTNLIMSLGLLAVGFPNSLILNDLGGTLLPVSPEEVEDQSQEEV